MRLKIMSIILILLSSIVFPLLVIYKLDKNIINPSKCPEVVLKKLNELNSQVHPYKIVLKPWIGRHHVHGIFMLPIEDNSSKLLVVSIPGGGTFCGGAHNVGNIFEGVKAKPGYYLIKTNFRTRTSIWLILRGFANQLKDSRNWRLINY